MTAESLQNSINYPFASHIETIVVFGISLFTYSALIIFIAVIILRLRKNRFQKHTDQMKASLNGILMSSAFAANEDELNEVIEKAKPEFQKQIKNDSYAQVMGKEVLTMHRSMSGQSKNNLSRLYQETCLMKYTLKDLNNENWHVKATAIKDIAQINAESHIPKIEKYAVHQNIFLQQVAQIALVNLKGYDGLDFLGKMKNVLSDWQQITLLDVLRRLDREKAPDFSQWLASKEDSIKIFSIRLIHLFHQTYNSDKLEGYVHYDNKVVRSEAITALQKLNPGFQPPAINPVNV